MIRTEDYDYNLPEELIAQTPLKDRSGSRLMILDRKNKKFSDHHFKEIIDYLTPNDVLVLNDTKVIPARLIGEKEETHASIEVLLYILFSGMAFLQTRWKLENQKNFSYFTGIVMRCNNGSLISQCGKWWHGIR